MTDVIIRTAQIADLNTLLEFEQSIITAERPYDKYLKPDPISYYDLKELVLSDIAEVTVAEMNKSIVGSGYALIKDSKPYMNHDRHCHLGYMYVDPAHRGKGINKLILNALKEWSKSQSVYHLSLNVYVENQAAIRAYEKAGFESNMTEMQLSLLEEKLQ